MNHVFKPYFRKFILAFFDDILIYNPTLELHLVYSRATFEVLTANTLYAKKSKCYFRERYVEYLGHIILKKGVATDPKKVEACKTSRFLPLSNSCGVF